MSELTVTIDATLISEAYKAGFVDGFELAVETPELDKTLNENKIDDAKGI